MTKLSQPSSKLINQNQVLISAHKQPLLSLLTPNSHLHYIPSCVPTLVVSAGPVAAAVTGPLPAAVKPVWVDGGNDGDVRGVHQRRDEVNTAHKLLTLPNIPILEDEGKMSKYFHFAFL